MNACRFLERWAVLGFLRFACANLPLLAEYEYASDSSAAACNTFAEASYSACVQLQSHQFLLLCSIGSPTTTSAYLHHETIHVKWRTREDAAIQVF